MRLAWGEAKLSGLQTRSSGFLISSHMEALGRTLLMVGGLLIMGGLVILLAARIGLPLGRLPGDLAWRGRYGSVFVPLGTSLLLSVVLSLLFWLLSSLRR